MVLFEVLLTALLAAAIVLGAAAWLTRPIWKAILDRCRFEADVERRAAGMRDERAEEAMRAREEAAGEVDAWFQTHAPEEAASAPEPPVHNRRPADEVQHIQNGRPADESEEI